MAAGFEGVREVFETGQLAVYVDGRQVVDLWAGEAVSGDSLHPVYSASKGAAHLVMALLVQDGVIDLDAKVAAYWAEFSADVTVRELLGHRSGKIGVDGGFTMAELADDRLMAERLAGQEPFWEPGSGYGYHAFVIGALSGEVVRRVTGRSIQELFEERVRAPFGLDMHLGLPSALESRFVEMLPGPEGEGPPAGSLTAVAFNHPTDLVAFGNSRRVRELGPTSSGGVGNARGLARMYAAAISGVDGSLPLLRPSTAAEFASLPWRGVDLVTGEVDHFAVGFEATGVRYPVLGSGAFGHCGAAGAQAFADPSLGLAYAYTTGRLTPPGGAAPVNDLLIPAVVQALSTAR